MGFLDVLSSTFSSSTTIYLGLAAIVLFFIYDYWTHTYFRRMGIPGPPPKPIFGNASDFFGAPMYEVLAEYSKKYGPIVGVYLWRRPCLMVSDPEVLRHIMIKDHHKFYNRLPIPVSSGVFDNALFALKDSQWKRVRDIMTPTFSGKKMKMMSDIINGCADDMVENLQKSCEKDGTIESLNLFGSFVVDTIASCGFGLKVNSQKDKDDPFVKNVAKFFKVSFTTPAFLVVAFLPWMRHVLQVLKVTLFPKDVINFFAEVTEKAIALRQNHSSKEVKADFLQLLLDANSGQNQTANENDDDDVHNKYFTDAGASEEVQTKSRKYMTREELLAQSMIFLAAGYETTSTLLTLASYLLATNPDQQEKLIAEIDDLAPKRSDVSYATVSKMPYLDQAVCEVLRIYPPATLVDRECDETCQYRGFTFEKGLQVWIPPYTLHHDPKYWPNPTKFDPDRFTKENREGRHPFTWIPFGAGPRICIGMRFALMEAKMALVRALQIVRFEVSPQTKIPPELGKTTLLSPPNGITLKVTRR